MGKLPHLAMCPVPNTLRYAETPINTMLYDPSDYYPAIT